MPLQYKTIPVTPFAQNCSIVWCDETRDAGELDNRTDGDRNGTGTGAGRQTPWIHDGGATTARR